MAIHWQVTFKTLRGGKVLTASVYDSTYSGNPIPLKGGAEPFVTEENDDDDPFKAIRIQTGSLNIIDDGYDANGNAFNWRDLQPRSDHDRPVILRDENNVILWQGFLQPQNFSGTLYEATQEREYPIQCALSILGSQYPTTTDQGIVNFAFLLKYCMDTVSAASLTVVAFTEIIIQGGADAQRWLSKKFHWANLLSEDNEEDLSPQYDLLTCLEDMCNFWGWQARTEGSRLYLMCQDDPSVQTLLTLSPADLATMATGTVAGTVSDNPFIRKELTGDIFASNDNDDMWMSGPSEVAVKADCNEVSTVVAFAPPSVRKLMEAAGDYSWVTGDEPRTGYFTTPPIRSFDSLLLAGSSNAYGGFCRRQIFSDEEAENATLEDMFLFKQGHTFGQPVIQIQTKRAMSYLNGTLKIKGDIFNGVNRWEDDNNTDFISLRVGIGMTYETAKWYYIYYSSFDHPTVEHRWQSQKYTLAATISGGSIKKVGSAVEIPLGYSFAQYDGIPCDDSMLYGYVFMDFLGLTYDLTEHAQHFEIGNFEISFTRDELIIPATGPRPRVVKKDLVSSMDYKSVNSNAVSNKQNIDLVYASDNNMKYGFGLVMEPTYQYMQGARYGDLVLQHPEQHFADRIADYWNLSKRCVTTDLRTEVVEQSTPITPLSHLVLDSTHFRTLAINHQWSDDITTVKMIQSLIEIEEEE
jgi:hypothetical protein